MSPTPKPEQPVEGKISTPKELSAALGIVESTFPWPDHLADGKGADLIGRHGSEEAWATAAVKAVTTRRNERIRYLLDNGHLADPALRSAYFMLERSEG